MNISKKIFVSGSWENRDAIYEIMKDLKRKGHVITADWTNHIEKNKSTEYAFEDLKGINECDVFIFCHDEHKTGGKNYELGYAHALKKLIILYSLIGDSWETGCVFVRGNVHRKVSTYSEMIELLEWRNI